MKMDLQISCGGGLHDFVHTSLFYCTLKDERSVCYQTKNGEINKIFFISLNAKSDIQTNEIQKFPFLCCRSIFVQNMLNSRTLTHSFQ